MRILLIAVLTAALSAAGWSAEATGGTPSGGRGAASENSLVKDPVGDAVGSGRLKHTTGKTGDGHDLNDKADDADKSPVAEKNASAGGITEEERRSAPTAVARQGDLMIGRWVEARKQMKTDLDGMYDANLQKRPDKGAREGAADALFTALTGRGMDPDMARYLIRGMAAGYDKDNAFAAVTQAVNAAAGAGKTDAQIVTEIQVVVNDATSAAALDKGLADWLPKK